MISVESDKDLDFEVRRVDLLYHQNRWGFVYVLACTTAFMVVQSSSSQLLPWLWFSVLNVSALFRVVLFVGWQKAKDSIQTRNQARAWLFAMASLLLVSGLGWGIIGFLSPQASEEQRAVTTLIISAMVGGALATNASSRLCTFCMCIPALSLWVAGMLLSGERSFVVMGIFVLVFLAMLILVSRNLNQFVTRALRLNAKLSESEERLRVARDSAQTLSWNWNLRSDELVCEGSLRLFDQPELHLRRLIDEHLKKGDALNFEATLIADGSELRQISVRGQVNRARSGEAISVAGICLDVTAQRNEEALRIERDVLDAANRSKSIFVANASHELRTPLSAIVGFAESLISHRDFPKSLHHEASAIVRHGRFMVSLVGDLLDLSKIESKKLFIQKSEMNPAREIQDSLTVVQPALDEKNLKVSIVYDSAIPIT